MNKEEPLRDQAQRLRKRISKKSEVQEELVTTSSTSTLPPRSRVHQQEQKRKKTRVKLKYPIIRLLALFFILLPIVSFSIYTINHNKEKAATESVDNNERGNIESVNVTDEDEGASISDSTVVEENVENVNEEVVAESVTDQEAEIVEPEEAENLSSTETTVNDKSTTPPVTATETSTDKGSIQSHTVQPGETLYRIAMKYYGSQTGIEKIKQANNIQGNEIQVGQTIKIPQ
ncbi:LysM peptidoglycan-binding domain-containing protein [Robertmurraya kyonggiensis]|uniref:LysM peptidoglycan-binding domain-containing protein n=1 Tax=Robertmurraya kyonggiensis TaxID=1037680 RepID=A0A4U1DB11_9BACI|nr:LysM peptidoglycan-binding domain-containing protein [Robertmurraya kyonggiensis]TKC19752.1 LysM peptidoglycan-binding domain-containing protein [Robertmurraya kyonggiensis]